MKANKTLLLLAGLMLAVPALGTAPKFIQANAHDNQTHANGSSYYSAADIGHVEGAWATQVIAYSSDTHLQFLCMSTIGGYGWGDYSITKVTIKLDVSQELGKHKIYTLEGSQSGFRLYNENMEKIAERYGDAQTTACASDTATNNSLFWNRTDVSIEARIPYATLTNGAQTKADGLVFGITFKDWYGNGHNMPPSSYTDDSTEFRPFNDPSTWLRIAYDGTADVRTNYIVKSEAPYNVYSKETKLHIGDTTKTIKCGEDYELEPLTEVGKVFKGYCFNDDGTGEYFPMSGKYDGRYPADLTLYPIFDIGEYDVSFKDGDVSYGSIHGIYGSPLFSPATEPYKDGFKFDGWYCGDKKLVKGATMVNNEVYEARYLDLYKVKFEGYDYTHMYADGSHPTPASAPKMAPGMVFVGWYDGDVLLDDSYVVTHDVTFKPVSKFNNLTYVGGESYYSAGDLGQTSGGGWPVEVFPYMTPTSVQFLCYATMGEWGGIDTTFIDIKLDVSQIAGINKVYTVRGSLDGFTLYDENGEIIAEKLHDANTTRVETDKNNVDIYFNYSGNLFNIEVRIPYVALVGEDYDFSKGTPVLGFDAYTYWANAPEGEEFSNGICGNPDDPTTYKRIVYCYDDDPHQNYTARHDAPYNVGVSYAPITFFSYGTAKTYQLEVGSAYEVLAAERDHATFVEWNTKRDGTGISFASNGIYTGCFSKGTKLYAIYDVEKFAIKFGDEPSVTYEYGDVVDIPTCEDFTEDGVTYHFVGWFDGDYQAKKGMTATANHIFEARYVEA